MEEEKISQDAKIAEMEGEQIAIRADKMLATQKLEDEMDIGDEGESIK